MIGAWPNEDFRRTMTRAEQAKLRLLVDFLVWLLTPRLSERSA
jgi:hypothetical protein